MGSKSRKRKALARLSSEYVAKIAESPLPRVEAVKALSELRDRTNPARFPKNRKASWVLSVEASGHQKIGGDRARSVMQTPQEKHMNARIRKARKPVTMTSNNGYTRYPSNQDSILAGVSEEGLHNEVGKVRVSSRRVN